MSYPSSIASLLKFKIILLSGEGRTPSANGTFIADFVGDSNNVVVIAADESFKVGNNALVTLDNVLVLSFRELILLSGSKEIFSL